MNRLFLIFALIIVILAGCESGKSNKDTTMTGPPKIENMEIDAAIESIPDGKQKKMLLKFKRRFEKGAAFNVTSRKACFEIIVTHRSDKDRTGGAEQYFLDKKTGQWKMGWHEHPMAIK